MLKVTYPLVAAAVFFGAAYGLIQAQMTADQEAEYWIKSVVESASTMGITLSKECLDAIRVLITERGFERAAVTNAGAVLIRDVHGVDEWVCR